MATEEIICQHCGDLVIPEVNGDCPKCLNYLGGKFNLLSQGLAEPPWQSEGSLDGYNYDWLDDENPLWHSGDTTLTELAELQRRRSLKARSLRRQSIAMFVLGIFSIFTIFPIRLMALLFFYKSLERFLISQRLAARHARLVLAEKNAKPVLYLRSFDADDSVGKNRLTVAKSLGLMLAAPVMVVVMLWKKRSAEEEMVRQVGRIGPVVAIGRPGERLPEVGAHRFYVTDDTWKEEVLRLIETSSLVVLRVGRTEGLLWEFKTVIESVSPRKIIIFNDPPNRLDPWVSELLPQPLAQCHSKYRFLTFDEAWNPIPSRKIGTKLLRNLIESTSNFPSP